MSRLSLPAIIRTERLLLQRLRYEDAEEIFYAYASKPEATRYVSWPTHRSDIDLCHHHAMFVKFNIIKLHFSCGPYASVWQALPILKKQ